MNIEQRIIGMSDDELDRFLQGLSDVLSGTGIGEAEAFTLIAEIEAIAIKEYRKRNPEVNNNRLGGLPDEQQAGNHIA